MHCQLSCHSRWAKMPTHKQSTYSTRAVPFLGRVLSNLENPYMAHPHHLCLHVNLRRYPGVSQPIQRLCNTHRPCHRSSNDMTSLSLGHPCQIAKHLHPAGSLRPLSAKVPRTVFLWSQDRYWKMSSPQTHILALGRWISLHIRRALTSSGSATGSTTPERGRSVKVHTLSPSSCCSDSRF